MTSATCSRSGSSSSPNNVVSAPNGTTANAANAAVAEMIGASAKSKRIGGARPQLLLEHQLDDVGDRLEEALGPTRYGPSRCCSIAATFRSTYTMTAAEFSSMTKTKSVKHDLRDSKMS